MPVTSCPACNSPRLLRYPASRRSQRRNFRCRGCGLVGWSDRDSLEPVASVGLDQVSVEQRAAWFQLKRAGVTEKAWDEALDRIESLLGGADGRKLYDVGAGDGDFLRVARKRGFDVGGNDLLAAAVEIARTEYEVELDLGDLSVLDPGDDWDAVSLWCVLAHVPEPDQLLRDALALLRPGGVLFLQTPRRSLADLGALGALHGTGGRVARLADRRIAHHHWLLQTSRSMRAMLERVGFTDVEVTPRARYSLQAAPYLQSLGVTGRTGRLAARAIDGLLDKELGPRIVLDAYARKPATLHA